MTRARTQRGSVSLLVVVLGAAILLLVALVYDAGELLNARQQAYAAAGEASRAGAQALAPRLRDTSTPTLDPDGAAQAAAAYLTPLGYQAAVIVAGDTVTVTATTTGDLGALGRMLDLAHPTITATASATAVRGVRKEDQ